MAGKEAETQDYAKEIAELIRGLTSDSSVEQVQGALRIVITFLSLKAGEKFFYQTLRYGGGGPNFVKLPCDPVRGPGPPPHEPVLELAAYALSLVSLPESR